MSVVTTQAGEPSSSHAVRKIVPMRRTGTWITAIIVLAISAMVIDSLANNPNLNWAVVGQHLTAPLILRGLWTTIWLTVVTIIIGYILGTGLAAMRLSSNVVLNAVSWAYVWLFRSIPLLVLLLFWFNIAAIYPRIEVPFADQLIWIASLVSGQEIDPKALSAPSQQLITTMMAALFGLIMHEAAYAAEIVRGGILSVHHGQQESATALGLSKFRIFTRIILPQAMRSIIPAAGNSFIGMLKGTSIVSVLAVEDLLYSAQIIYNFNYHVIPLLLVATIWYVILTSVLSIFQYYIERHYARGSRSSESPAGMAIGFVGAQVARVLSRKQ